jgi:hypothetical protein
MNGNLRRLLDVSDLSNRLSFERNFDRFEYAGPP